MAFMLLGPGDWRGQKKDHRQIARILKKRGGHLFSLTFPKRRNSSEGGAVPRSGVTNQPRATPWEQIARVPTMSTSSDQRNPVELLAEDFLERKRGGEQPTLREYVERYPALADEIRDLFPALLMMEDLGDSSGATT